MPTIKFDLLSLTLISVSEDFLFVCALKIIVVSLLVSLLLTLEDESLSLKGRKLICSNRLYFVRKLHAGCCRCRRRRR